jgi:hypothetical protein
MPIRIHFDADPGSGYRSFLKLYTSWKSENFSTFIHSNVSLHCFYLSHHGYRCHNFQYFGHHIEFLWKKHSLPLPLVEIYTDPDPSPDPDRQALDADHDPDPDQAKICRSDRIRIHNTGQTPLVLLIYSYCFFFSNSFSFSTLSHPTRLIFGSDPWGGGGGGGGGAPEGGRFRVLMIPVGHSMWAK